MCETAMNLRDLKYLVAVAQHQHFSKAAAACFVSQPTLSAQLKKLEDSLGVSLFERHGKKMVITPVGAKIAHQSQLVLQETQKLYEIANATKDPFGGDIKVGIIPTLGPYLLPYILPLIKKQYSTLRLIIQEEKTHVTLQALRSGLLDIAILALPVNEEGLISQHLFDEPFYVALYKQHKLAQSKKTHITLAELKNEPLLLLEEGHCLRDNILDFCSSVTTHEMSDFRATSLATLIHLVVNQNGITLLPKLACHKTPGIITKSLLKPVPYRRIAMFWRKHSPRQICYKAITQLIQQRLATEMALI